MAEELDNPQDEYESLSICDYERIRMLADALNFPLTLQGSPETATDLEELERILKQHYRP